MFKKKTRDKYTIESWKFFLPNQKSLRQKSDVWLFNQIFVSGPCRNSFRIDIDVSLNVTSKKKLTVSIYFFKNYQTHNTLMKSKLKATNVAYRCNCPLRDGISCHKPIFYIGHNSTSISRRIIGHLSDMITIKKI